MDWFSHLPYIFTLTSCLPATLPASIVLEIYSYVQDEESITVNPSDIFSHSQSSFPHSGDDFGFSYVNFCGTGESVHPTSHLLVDSINDRDVAYNFKEFGCFDRHEHVLDCTSTSLVPVSVHPDSLVACYHRFDKVVGYYVRLFLKHISVNTSNGEQIFPDFKIGESRAYQGNPLSLKTVESTLNIVDQRWGNMKGRCLLSYNRPSTSQILQYVMTNEVRSQEAQKLRVSVLDAQPWSWQSLEYDHILRAHPFTSLACDEVGKEKQKTRDGREEERYLQYMKHINNTKRNQKNSKLKYSNFQFPEQQCITPGDFWNIRLHAGGGGGHTICVKQASFTFTFNITQELEKQHIPLCEQIQEFRTTYMFAPEVQKQPELESNHTSTNTNTVLIGSIDVIHGTTSNKKVLLRNTNLSPISTEDALYVLYTEEVAKLLKNANPEDTVEKALNSISLVYTISRITNKTCVTICPHYCIGEYKEYYFQPPAPLAELHAPFIKLQSLVQDITCVQ